MMGPINCFVLFLLEMNIHHMVQRQLMRSLLDILETSQHLSLQGSEIVEYKLAELWLPSLKIAECPSCYMFILQLNLNL